jgi:uncharacterized protein YdhG (YjbR/CyaY superfamily)
MNEITPEAAEAIKFYADMLKNQANDLDFRGLPEAADYLRFKADNAEKVFRD